MNCRILVPVAACLLAWPFAAAAHPHIFVRYDVAIAPAETGFLKLHFTFHINAPANPILAPGASSADTPLLTRDMLANLASHPFYIYLAVDGENLGRQEVRPVPAGGKDGTLYAFDLNLPDTGGNFSFALYDPSYFVSVTQSGADAVKVKIDKIACAVTERQVANTVWGAVRATFVGCGNKAGGKPPVFSFKPSSQDATPGGQEDFDQGRKLLP